MVVQYVAWLCDSDTMAAFEKAKKQTKFCKKLAKKNKEETLLFGDSTDFWPLECALMLLRKRGVSVPEDKREHMQLSLGVAECATALEQVTALGKAGVRVKRKEAVAAMIELREDDDDWADSIRSKEVKMNRIIADFVDALKLAAATQKGMLIWAPY